jgi:DNA-binding CsgD family transcriptional regulator
MERILKGKERNKSRNGTNQGEEQMNNKLILNPRMAELIEHVLNGYTSAYIAGLMSIKERTVKNMTTRLLKKLGKGNRSATIVYYLKNKPDWEIADRRFTVGVKQKLIEMFKEHNNDWFTPTEIRYTLKMDVENFFFALARNDKLFEKAIDENPNAKMQHYKYRLRGDWK